MPIITLQRQMREIGRIRTGQTVVTNGKRRPAKLERFRLTSRSREVIEAAAAVYGGKPQAWNDQWEVFTEADTMDIVLRPGQPIDQWYELWSGGGCVRRCNGEVDILSDAPCGSAPSTIDTGNGKRTIPACPRDPADRRDVAAAGMACKPTTRLSVILPAIPDLGSWRLESHGYYAAVELAGTVSVLAQADRLLPARLRLEQRETKRIGRPVNRYAVPVLELMGVRIVDLIEIGDGTRPAIPERVDRRERTARPPLPPGPEPSRARLTPGTTSAPEAPRQPSGADQGAGSAPPVPDAPAVVASPEPSPPGDGEADAVIEGTAVVLDAAPTQCPQTSPYEGNGRCGLAVGHRGYHKNRDKESWE